MTSSEQTNTPRILGLIPARGGSKTVPGKNVRPLLGKPLIAYAIAEALKSRLLRRVIVSTDDEQIAEVARGCGAEVPFLRPKELATDESPAIDTIKHALIFMENIAGITYDYVCLLQPTAPMRTAEDIDGSITMILEAGADSLASVTDVGAYHPARMKKIVGGRLVDIVTEDLTFVRKQDLPHVYIFNGAVYITRRDIILERNSVRGKDCMAYVMPPERSVNIDTELDLIVAGVLMKG